MKPFTYVVTHRASGRRYYGVRHWRRADPSELGTTYFTSSKTVKKLIKEEGVDAFTFEVRKVFDSAEKALSWEQRFLTKIDAARNPNWFNKHNGGRKFHNTGHSEETKRKLSERGRGRPKSEEHKRKIAAKSTWVGKLTPEQIKLRPVHTGDSWRALHADGVQRMKQSKIGLKRVYREDGTFFMQRPQEHQ